MVGSVDDWARRSGETMDCLLALSLLILEVRDEHRSRPTRYPLGSAACGGGDQGEEPRLTQSDVHGGDSVGSE